MTTARRPLATALVMGALASGSLPPSYTTVGGRTLRGFVSDFGGDRAMADDKTKVGPLRQ
jgi:hypothetical protein